jgi:hypothetical protein
MNWFFYGLALLFIGLKLTGYIAWSWWWVLAPIWLPITIFLPVATVIMIVKTRHENSLEGRLARYARRASRK